MATASLELHPSGVKSGKVFSQVPTNGDGDFDFTRGSTATRVNENGLIEDVATGVPRLDYTDSGCPVLLLEPQRTNLITYSEDFTQGAWIKVGTSVVSDNAISPNGTLDATKLVESSASEDHRIDFQGVSTSSGSKYSLSLFVKANGRSIVKVRDFATNAYINVDLETNTILTTNLVNSTGKCEDLGNDWKRISFTFTASSSVLIRIYTEIADNTSNYQGDGTSGLYIWGAQLELGSYPTSYIPTVGTTVTRVAETCNGSGNSEVFNDSEGVLMVEISAFEEIPTTSEHIVLRNSASTDFSNSILIQHRTDGNLRIYADGFSTGNIQFIVTDMNWLVNNKIAIQYDSIGSNYKLFLNGTTKARYSSAANQSVVGLNDISFYWGSANNPFYGNTKQIQYFDTALTDQELIALTAL